MPHAVRTAARRCSAVSSPFSFFGRVRTPRAGRRWRWCAGHDVRANSAASADYPRHDAGSGCSRPARWAGCAEQQLGGVLSARERQQRCGDVRVGELVVGAAEHRSAVAGRRALHGRGRPVHQAGSHARQAGPRRTARRSGPPGGSAIRLRATAERDHHPLPSLTATGIVAAGAGLRGSLASVAASHSRASSRSADRLPVSNGSPAPLPPRGRVDVAAASRSRKASGATSTSSISLAVRSDRIGHGPLRREHCDLRDHVGQGTRSCARRGRWRSRRCPPPAGPQRPCHTRAVTRAGRIAVLRESSPSATAGARTSTAPRSISSARAARYGTLTDGMTSRPARRSSGVQAGRTVPRSPPPASVPCSARRRPSLSSAQVVPAPGA